MLPRRKAESLPSNTQKNISYFEPERISGIYCKCKVGFTLEDPHDSLGVF